jgi:CTP:molybdopterin cytidylyltransferase MocA
MKVAALALAADVGSGFDDCKYLLPLRGSTLIETVVAEVHSWPVDGVIVVLGPDAERIVAATDFGEATIVIDPEWEEGEAAPLRVGLDTLYREDVYDALILTYLDDPAPYGSVVDRLLAARRHGGRPAIVPKYRYAAGYPIVVGAELWPRLIGLEGSASVDQVLQSHRDWMEEVWFDRLPPRRILTRDDLLDVRGAR